MQVAHLLVYKVGIRSPRRARTLSRSTEGGKLGSTSGLLDARAHKVVHATAHQGLRRGAGTMAHPVPTVRQAGRVRHGEGLGAEGVSGTPRRTHGRRGGRATRQCIFATMR
jgi:hypothetical protein